MKKTSIVLVLAAVGIAAICILVLSAFPQEEPFAPPSPFSVGILVVNRDNVSHQVHVSVSGVNGTLDNALLSSENFTFVGGEERIYSVTINQVGEYLYSVSVDGNSPHTAVRGLDPTAGAIITILSDQEVEIAPTIT
ncbi:MULTISPECIES: hypothetical protein [unclassified Methanoculleus]|jgi:hypothetical protein|uniref:Uncharacterized protein n=1 Tax=Methanoculleus palmolei TaxID=72612 RepID=A0ABD8ABD8_9EURY|nr:hypothetical protein [Methanoculleus sp. UBA377]MDD2472479.1 hypothetical protein [Methanoculleus sp.]WOX56510.1 hypothetical protein R6Y95_04045 [Methanoculleus palmolei]